MPYISKNNIVSTAIVIKFALKVYIFYEPMKSPSAKQVVENSGWFTIVLETQNFLVVNIIKESDSYLNM